jgi:glutamyl-tRNA reductase
LPDGDFVAAIPVSHERPLGRSAEAREIAEGFETVATPLSLFGLEFSLGTASLDSLEAVVRSVTKAQVGDWFARFRSTEEVALLSTCHRVELALLVRSPEALGPWREVLPGNRDSWNLREGRELVHHLYRVAAGQESLAVGEGEVRHQVRAAVQSIQSRHSRPVLRELLTGAAAAAEEVYPLVPTSHSIASVAASRLLELVGEPHPRVLVVGSGTVGRQVTESLAASARVTVVFHQRAPEDSFLRSTGARAVPLDCLRAELATSDAVVTAAKFGNHGLCATDLPRDRPLVLVDLGVPRNIDPNVRDLPNARLVDLEELHTWSENFSSTSGHPLRTMELADRFSDRLGPLLLEPWIDAFRRSAEEVRRSELENARTFFGDLDPNQEIAIERLTRRLVARLLLPPTERIRSLPPGPEGDLQRRFAVELLRPRSPDP